MQKDTRIEFRCSTLDKEIIHQKAVDAGLSVSDYVLYSSLGKNLKKRLDNDEIEAFKMLIQYANHFSRISNLMRLGDESWRDDILSTSVAIRSLLKTKFK